MKRAVTVGLALATLTAAAAPGLPGDACLQVAADLERAEQARKAAVDKGDNAWKAVLPFVVVALKASSKAAVDEADRQLAALRRQAEAGGCDAR